MIIALLVSVAAILLVPAAAASLRGRTARVRTAVDLIGRVRPLDWAAFRNLTDPGEEEYLRRNLSSRNFRVVQRARLGAAAAYVRLAAANAAVLLRLAEAARESSDAAVAEAGAALSQQALRLRMLSLMTLLKIGTAWVWPGGQLPWPELIESYEDVAGTATRLGRLQQPARASAVYSVF